MPAIPFSSYQTEFKHLIRLAFPILLAQLALTGLGVVDTIMSGQVGTDDLAAIGLGTSLLFPVFMISTGILLALTPLVAKQKGRQNWQGITHYLHQSLWLSIPLGLFSLLTLMHLQWVLDLLTLSATVYQLTNDYLIYIAFGLPGIVLYQAFRFFWEGLGLTIPTMLISFFALLLNIPLNAVFIYGWGPVDAYGAAGCGIASALVMWAMFLVSVVYVLSSPKTRSLVCLKLSSFERPSWSKGISDILSLGIPNTLALLFEVSLFSFIALFIAQLGTVVIAAHQVAISYTSLAFMVPLSVAMAITVRVGEAYGQGSLKALKVSMRTGVGSAALFSGVIALFTYVMMQDIAALYTTDTKVILLAGTLLLFAAFYQVFDAVQVASAGALRGLHSTKVTMVVTFISYWLIGLGMGYVFAFTDWIIPKSGVAGFWLGIVLGLILAAVLLQVKLHVLVKRLTREGELA
ncbi:Multidrug resistance protein NorM [Hydrogenovibrio crunogenus]|uniref:Multidrug-efflux transporter n=1 Tax=Hydrogenovibrio crunogenus TaxID=39765 RepID=A0A4P7P095_9GAMM|nr:MATE family efflux transporter [Hydrogenovibrio crunogenus]QBZ83376.1 Multidrug resistance protein NorM [Hydrogenovibrio crunogenus]